MTPFQEFDPIWIQLKGFRQEAARDKTIKIEELDMERSQKVSKEDVIAKLKDDGDFDRLRLKIIRQLKDNEELRNNIISMVRQSEALNRVGAENMKPRQLSDAIHEEVGNNIMNRISDGVWEIIRSDNGMKGEITETIQSVYNKVLNPKRKEEGEPSSPRNARPVLMEVENNGSLAISVSETDETLYDNEPKMPPGFFLCDNNNQNNCEGQNKEELQLPTTSEKNPSEKQNFEPGHSQIVSKPDDVHLSVPPGFSSAVEHMPLCDNSDEDPDVPPGFG